MATDENATLYVNSPLVKLRVSLARLAQQLDLGYRIPGRPDDGTAMNFEQLTRAAIEHERGWNALAASISTLVDRMQRDAQRDAETLRREREAAYKLVEAGLSTDGSLDLDD